MPEPRYAPAIPLPPYSYVPGHKLPHPVNDPAGHLYGVQHDSPITPAELALLPTELTKRGKASGTPSAARLPRPCLFKG